MDNSIKYFWIHKDEFEKVQRNRYNIEDLSDGFFYGTIEEVKEFEKENYSKFQDWIKFELKEEEYVKHKLLGNIK